MSLSESVRVGGGGRGGVPEVYNNSRDDYKTSGDADDDNTEVVDDVWNLAEPIDATSLHPAVCEASCNQRQLRLFDPQRPVCWPKRTLAECASSDFAHLMDPSPDGGGAATDHVSWHTHIERGDSAPAFFFPYVCPHPSAVLTTTLHYEKSWATLDAFLNDRTGNAIIEIDIPKQRFQAIKGLEHLTQGGKHAARRDILPLEFSLQSVFLEGIKVPLSIHLRTNDGKNAAALKRWTSGHVAHSSGSASLDHSAFMVSAADNGMVNQPIWRADESIVCRSRFLRWMPVDFDDLRKTTNELTNSRQNHLVDVPVPAPDVTAADNIIQWLAVTQYSRLLERTSKSIQDELGAKRFTDRSSGSRLRVPKDQLLEAIAAAENIVCPSDHLLSLSNGIKLAVAPYGDFGWAGAPDTAIVSKSVTHPLNTSKPVSMHFMIKFRFIVNKHYSRHH
jgi:hypothetical protein